jgi:hypothetical protein
MDGRMGGRIVGHDGVGGWLLGEWLLVDMLLWIWVKRLSFGCVAVEILCQTSFPSKGPHDKVDKEHLQDKKTAFDPMISPHGSNGKHEQVCKRRRKKATSCAMVKLLSISLA